MIVNKTRLSEILGYTHKTLTEWQKEGMPIAHQADSKGFENQYETADVIQWVIDRAISKQDQVSAREYKDRMQGRKLEIDIEEKLNRLVSVEAIEPLLENAILGARNELISGMDSLRIQIRSEHGVEITRATTNVIIDRILMKISNLNMGLDKMGGATG